MFFKNVMKEGGAVIDVWLAITGRRKTHPDHVATAGLVNDERSSSYLLISLLRNLSTMHCKYLI